MTMTMPFPISLPVPDRRLHQCGWFINGPAFLAVWLSIPAWVSAQPNVSGYLPSWIAPLESASFQTPTRPQWSGAVNQAQFELERLNRFLDATAVGESWSQYLQLVDLEDALNTLDRQADEMHRFSSRGQQNESSTDEISDGETFDDGESATTNIAPEIIEALNSIRRTLGRLIGSHEGIEREPLIRFRRSLQRVLVLGALLTDRDLPTIFKRERSALLRTLNEALRGSALMDADWYRQVLPRVSWLDEYGLVPELVNSLRSVLSKPNLQILVSASALNTMTRREVQESEPINECSDGRRITGRAVAVGSARMVPVASVGTAECRVVFDGSIQSTLNGSEGPVSFGLLGTTSLHVEQPVRLTDAAFRVLPPISSSQTDLQTRRIATRRNGVGSRLVRRIAAKQIAKERPEAARDLDRQSVDKFLEEFARDVSKEMQDAERGFQQEVVVPLTRMDVRPDDLEFASDAEVLRVHMTVDGGFGLGAPLEPLRMISGAPTASSLAGTVGCGEAFDFAIRMHETVVNRLGQRYFAGETVEDIPGMVDAFGGEIPTEIMEKLPDDIGIDFAKLSPISARFDDDAIELTFRGDRYRLGRAVLVAMNAKVRYGVDIVDGRLRLTRQGVPEVLPPAAGRGGRFFFQKNVLQKRLEKELPKVEFVDRFDLPSPADKLGRFHFEGVQIRDGWLTLRLRGDRIRRKDWSAHPVPVLTSTRISSGEAGIERTLHVVPTYRRQATWLGNRPQSNVFRVISSR